MKHKNQHTVPRSYLAGFVDPNTPEGQEPFLWVYDRKGSHAYARAPKKVSIKTYYYSFTTPEGERDHTIEHLLDKVESEAMPVLRLLDVGAAPDELSEAQRAAVALFIAFLEVRVPRFREQAERIAGEIARRTAVVTAAHPASFEKTVRNAYEKANRPVPEDIESGRQFILDGDYTMKVNPATSLVSMVQLAPMVADYVYNFHRRLLTATKPEFFITSDAPLARVDIRPHRGLSGVGWETPDMEATVPLSTSTALLIRRGRSDGRFIASTAQLYEINRRTTEHAYREIYAGTKLEVGSLYHEARSPGKDMGDPS